MAVREVVLDRHVAALKSRAPPNRGETPRQIRRLSLGPRVEPAGDRLRLLLRPAKERPPSRAKARNKFAPPHLQSSRFKAGAWKLKFTTPQRVQSVTELTNRGTTKERA